MNLTVYYRMCDELVTAIKNNKELMATDASRFSTEEGKSFYPDTEKHILAFDLIYCCSTYGLFDGITFVRPKSKERQLMQERKDKAVLLSKKLEVARRDMEKLEEGKTYVNSVLLPGAVLRHKKYGSGIIKSNSETTITVDFADVGEKQLGTFVSVANDLVHLDDEEVAVRISEYKDVLKKENAVKTSLSIAEKEFAPYAEYLG